jgi:hypothetical protein
MRGVTVKAFSRAKPHDDLMDWVQPLSAEISLRNEESLEELGKVHGPPYRNRSKPEDNNEEITEGDSHQP